MTHIKLYPLVFKPVIKEKIWGGSKLATYLNKDIGNITNAGESWEISAVPGDETPINNGPLKGIKLGQAIDKYGAQLVGQSVLDRFGNQFPLLIKFIDAKADLSVQVHPNDKIAKKRHNSFGKTEMWYVMQTDKGSKLIAGFNKKLSLEEYKTRVEENRLMETLALHEVEVGDVLLIPTGRVHAIGAGVLLAEIQQTSDITYRIYDFDRRDQNGNLRELHTELAIDANDFELYDNYKTDYQQEVDTPNKLIDTPFFKTNLIILNNKVVRDYSSFDSFIIYICLEGEAEISWNDEEKIKLKMGDSILIPAEINDIILHSKSAKIIEVYI